MGNLRISIICEVNGRPLTGLSERHLMAMSYPIEMESQDSWIGYDMAVGLKNCVYSHRTARSPIINAAPMNC